MTIEKEAKNRQIKCRPYDSKHLKDEVEFDVWDKCILV